jgi:hypothetical protein
MVAAAPTSEVSVASWRSRVLPPLAVSAVAFTALVARRPEALFRSEFSFEGGSVFYAGTYFGSVPEILFRPYAGYQHLLARVISFLERVVPVQMAPLASHIVALALIAGLAAFIASDRLRTLVPSRGARLALAGLLVVLPNVQESAGVVGDIQRYIPIYLLALSLVPPPVSRWGRRLELAWLAVISISGPFAAFMQPIFWWRAWKRRDSYSISMVVILAAGAVVQLLSIAIDGRHAANLADPITLARIWAFRDIAGGFLGQTVTYHAILAGVPMLVGVLVTVVLAVCLVWLWWKALPLLPRAYVGYTWLVFATTPFFAQTEGVGLMANPAAANRYFLAPAAMTAIVVFAGYVRLRRPPERWVALLAAIALAVGIGGDLRLPVMPFQDWAHRSACIGGRQPCVVPVFEAPIWDILWPGSGGTWVQPRPGG